MRGQAARFVSRRRRRDLRRDLRAQQTEEFWRKRAAARGRRSQLIAFRYRFAKYAFGAGGTLAILGDSLPKALKSLAGGGVLFTIVVAGEALVDRTFQLRLVPSGSGAPPLGAFPGVATQVSAALLGFYLASVSIVLG